MKLKINEMCNYYLRKTSTMIIITAVNIKTPTTMPVAISTERNRNVNLIENMIQFLIYCCI